MNPESFINYFDSDANGTFKLDELRVMENILIDKIKVLHQKQARTSQFKFVDSGSGIFLLWYFLSGKEEVYQLLHNEMRLDGLCITEPTPECFNAKVDAKNIKNLLDLLGISPWFNGERELEIASQNQNGQRITDLIQNGCASEKVAAETFYNWLLKSPSQSAQYNSMVSAFLNAGTNINFNSERLRDRVAMGRSFYTQNIDPDFGRTQYILEHSCSTGLYFTYMQKEQVNALTFLALSVGETEAQHEMSTANCQNYENALKAMLDHQVITQLNPKCSYDFGPYQNNYSIKVAFTDIENLPFRTRALLHPMYIFSESSCPGLKELADTQLQLFSKLPVVTGTLIDEVQPRLKYSGRCHVVVDKWSNTAISPSKECKIELYAPDYGIEFSKTNVKIEMQRMRNGTTFHISSYEPVQFQNARYTGSLLKLGTSFKTLSLYLTEDESFYFGTDHYGQGIDHRYGQTLVRVYNGDTADQVRMLKREP